MLHSEWQAPLNLSAPVWGIITLVGYVLFIRLSNAWDKGQWDNGQWKK